MALARPRIKVFPADNKEYGWHLQDRNGKLIATSGETFTREADAKRAAKNARRTFALAKVETP